MYALGTLISNAIYEAKDLRKTSANKREMTLVITKLEEARLWLYSDF